jgi:hypothetical protein
MTPPPAAAAEQRALVDDFGKRIATFRSPPTPRDWIVNPSFEDRGADPAIAGWVHSRGPGIEVNVDRTRGHQSASSLHLVSRAPPGGAAPIVWTRSATFEAPPTGRIAVAAWIRVADPTRQPKLRIAIEGKIDGQVYYMRDNVGASEYGNPVRPLTTEFSLFIFPVTELPLGGLTELRVGFDLMGEGEVWIDEVQVFDLRFEAPEYHALLSRMAIVKSTQLADGELAHCQAFVDGYWPSFLRRHVKLDEPRALPALDGPPLPQAPNHSARSNAAARSARTKADDPPPTPRWRSWIPSWPKWR